MKKILFLLLISVGAFGQTVHRVTNGMNLQTVINNAVSGDVIMVEAGVYGNIEVNKKLDLYGTGYYLNNSNSAYIGTSTVGTVTFLNGSEISTLQGFLSGYINVSANNITIRRNKSGRIRIGYNGNAETRADNILVQQNLAERPEVYGQSINFVIKNNIFYNGFYFKTTGLGIVTNNTFDCDLSNYEAYFGIDFYNVEFKNNIIGGFWDHTNGGYGYNEGYGRQFIDVYTPFILQKNIFKKNYTQLLPSNYINVDFTNMYFAYPNNPNNLQEDARYQLAPNSPAKGAGENGTDCGAFGGDDPYVLSGIPSIPSIYQLTVPNQVPQNGTLNIQIKAKTNN